MEIDLNEYFDELDNNDYFELDEFDYLVDFGITHYLEIDEVKREKYERQN